MRHTDEIIVEFREDGKITIVQQIMTEIPNIYTHDLALRKVRGFIIEGAELQFIRKMPKDPTGFPWLNLVA